MEDTQLPTTYSQSLPTGKRRPTYSLAFRLFGVLVILALCFSCSSSANDGNGTGSVDTEETAGTSGNIHLAFAGGGWRAHTGHSAWTIALLDNGRLKLDDVFSNVETISSNSGGSWFSTMLMYSKAFGSAIEARSAIDAWGTTGWLGQQKRLFDAANCGSLSGPGYTNCVFDYYFPKEGEYYWNRVVEGIVFKDYPIEKDVTLSSPRQAWAQDKTLLLASTMLKSDVVLNSENNGKDPNHRWYQACLSPGHPYVDGDKGGICVSEKMPTDVTPVTFSSLPNKSGLTAPHFLPEAGDSLYFNATYTLDKSSAPKIHTTINNPVVTDEVPVVIAASASSAALGFGAMEKLSGSFSVAYGVEDEAPGFELVNSKAHFQNPSDELSLKSLAERKAVRLADGGPTDNSAVAHLVSFLQLNQKAEAFNIVAFDNVQQLYRPGGNAAAVGIDFANLFGLGNPCGDKICADTLCFEACVKLPDIKIFAPTSVKTTSSTWSSPPDAKGNILIYTKYSVTTVDNSTFGIKAGTTGTLHAFTCAWADASTAPENLKGKNDFTEYAEMLRYINKGLLKNNSEGLKHLQTALGLKN